MGQGGGSRFSLKCLRGCLGRSLQQIFKAPDVRAGLFLARASLSTSWPTVGAQPWGFPEEGEQLGCQVSLEEPRRGTPTSRDTAPASQWDLHGTGPGNIGDQASLILPAHCISPRAEPADNSVLFFVV